MSPAPIRVLIVDDHEVVRLGLRTLLQYETDIQVVDEAGTCEQAIRKSIAHQPDVVVLDVQLPDRSGLEACREIRKVLPETQVIMLTSYLNDAFVIDALRAGASGYVLKKVGNDELLRAIRAAVRGELALDPQTTAKLVAQVNSYQTKMEQDAFRDLSPRELDTLLLVSHGKSNREIGAALNISEITARNYVSTLLDKLNLRNRIELATYALRHRLEDYRHQQE